MSTRCECIATSTGLRCRRAKSKQHPEHYCDLHWVAALLIKQERSRPQSVEQKALPRPTPVGAAAAAVAEPEIESEERKEKEKETTLSVLTLNVQTYETCHAQNTCDAITADLENLRPEVLAVQEDWFDSPADQFKGYLLAAKCKAEQLNGRFLANSIYLRSDVAGSAPEALDISGGCSVPRCATFVTVKGIRIANLHACGGRFDDRKYAKMAAEKTKEQHVELVAQKKPDLIVGDFNADNDPQAAERALQGYELYKKLDEKNKALFRDFFLGHVAALKKRGFMAAYDSRAVGPTSVYGSTVDWMYYKQEVLEPVGPPTVVKTIDKKYTDHNGVLVTFRVLNRR